MIYPIETPWWDEEKLLIEVENIHADAVDQENDPRPVKFYKGPYPELQKLAEGFDKLCGGAGFVTTGYIYGISGEQLDWHTDNGVESAYRKLWEHDKDNIIFKDFQFDEFDEGQEIKCAFNVILMGTDGLEFLDGPVNYKSAIVNTSVMHRVLINDTRIIAKIQIRDYDFDTIVEKIRERNG